MQWVYLLLQKELQDINLNIKGTLNNRFCNSKEKLQLRFHQNFITSMTLNKISENEKKILWGWKCRAGKTFGIGGLLIKYLKKFKRCNSLIITPAPTETISQFVNDMFNRYRDFNTFTLCDQYTNGGKNFFIPYRGYTVKIIDYDFTYSQKYQNAKITSYKDTNFKTIGYGPFVNPVFDVHFLLNSFYSSETIMKKIPKFKKSE